MLFQMESALGKKWVLEWYRHMHDFDTGLIESSFNFGDCHNFAAGRVWQGMIS